MRQIISIEESKNLVTGEITLAAVMAVCAIAVMAVVVYKMFMTKEGSSTIPGGWKFTWK